MRLPHHHLESLGFLAESADELVALLGSEASDAEAQLIRSYFSNGLPPITSRAALAVMFGYSEGFLWSLLTRTGRYYRKFEIPKGRGRRTIYAPQVGLKLIQKWLSIHFQKKWIVHDSVYGFVPGRSHLEAAARHIGRDWVVSVDLENFFPNISQDRVRFCLEKLGYVDEFSKEAITKLACLHTGLAQGSPVSPILSNSALGDTDRELAELTDVNGWTFTRYADDIVVSGNLGAPESALTGIQDVLLRNNWKIAENKTHIDRRPNRLKVHGLLVHGDKIRLTKGYRNRLRAYRHLLANSQIRQSDLARIKGHISFANSVDAFNAGPLGEE